MKIMPIKKFAEESGMSEVHIRNMISEGTFPHQTQKYGRRTMIVFSDNAIDYDLLAEKTAQKIRDLMWGGEKL